MEIQKTLEAGEAYNPIDTYWWIHNNLPYSTYTKKSLTFPINEWYEWVNNNFDAFQIDYKSQTKDKKEEFIESEYRGVKIGRCDILIQTKQILKTKDEITIDFYLYWGILNDDYVKNLISEILEKSVYKIQKSSVYMVITDDDGLDLRSFDINIPELDIELNYGPDWKEKHEYLLKALAKENKKGIALLHGAPGTGKSMYIRHLISILAENRTMIYLPNQLINSITDPSFIPMMADYPNSILIIEDAEEAVKSRKSGGYTVDKLLNLSDGIISDFLGTQIICTFNSDVTMIDEALLRKGRLILKHEFKKLAKEQSQKLIDKLGFEYKATKEMTLAEIYNIDEKYNDQKEENKIGFNR